jgi:hypothetical protein
MSRKTNSMRGEVVDFDLLAIKEQINGSPVTETIQNREKFIDLKRRRGTKRKLQDMLAEQEVSQRSVTESLANKNSGEAEPSAASDPKRKITKKDA